MCVLRHNHNTQLNASSIKIIEWFHWQTSEPIQHSLGQLQFSTAWMLIIKLHKELSVVILDFLHGKYLRSS